MARRLIKPGAPEAPSTGNGRRVTNFPTGRTYRGDLYITGGVTSTGGAVDGAAIEDAPFTYVTSIKVKTRRGTHIDSDGQALKHLAAYEQNGIAPSSSGPTIAGAGTATFTMHVPLPFAPDDLKVPEALCADIRDGEEPKLDTTYGAVGTLAAGGDRTLTIAATTVADLVCAQEDEPINPNLVRTIETVTKPVTAAQSDFQIDLTAQRGRRTRAIHIMARNGSTMVRSNALVTLVKLLRASGQVFFEATWADLQEDNKRAKGVAPATGIAVIDFDRMKVLAKLPRTEEFSAYKLQLTVIAPTGTAEVKVTTDSVIDRDKFGV